MYFLKLPDPEFAMARVKQRVKQGGHNVAEDTARCRFNTGWNHFEIFYKDLQKNKVRGINGHRRTSR